MTEDERSELTQLRGFFLGKTSPFIAGGSGKVMMGDLLEEAIRAAQNRDPAEAGQALWTARYMLRDRGNDPAILDPAFKILGREAKRTEDQDG